MHNLSDSVFWVEVDRIKPNPYQPRREFDEAKLRELGESIKQYGLLQPITVTRKEIPKEDGGLSVEYELISGERRLRASKLMHLEQIPVIIRTGENTDQLKLELAIIENLQREDINPMERAKAFKQLGEQFKLTNVEIAKKVGRSREYVSNTMRLLKLPSEIQDHIANGKLTEGHARPLLMLNDRKDEQQVLLKEILLKKLSVRESETIAQRAAHEKTHKKTMVDQEVVQLEKELTESLVTRVHIEPKEVGCKVVISYFSTDDLRSLLDLMKAENNVPNVFTKAEEKIDEKWGGAVEEQPPVPIQSPQENLQSIPHSPQLQTTPAQHPPQPRQELTDVWQESGPSLHDQSNSGSISQQASSASAPPQPAVTNTQLPMQEPPHDIQPAPHPVPAEYESHVPMKEPEHAITKTQSEEEQDDMYSVKNFSI